MQVREFRPSDTKSTDKWLRVRGIENLKTECCSIGFIVPGVAAAQLLQAENGTAVFDSLVTNPYVSAETRDKAADAIFTQLLSRCSEIGIKRILGFSSDKNTLVRALKHGFLLLPHVLVARGI